MQLVQHRGVPCVRLLVDGVTAGVAVETDGARVAVIVPPASGPSRAIHRSIELPCLVQAEAATAMLHAAHKRLVVRLPCVV